LIEALQDDVLGLFFAHHYLVFATFLHVLLLWRIQRQLWLKVNCRLV